LRNERKSKQLHSAQLSEPQKAIVIVNIDTLINFDEHFLQHWQQKYPTTYQEVSAIIASRNKLHFEENFPLALREKALELQSSIELSSTIPARLYAIKAINEMVSLRYNVVLVTSLVSQQHFNHKYEWITLNLGKEFIPKLIVVEDKTTLIGRLYITDEPEVLGLNREAPQWLRVLFTRPYNKSSNASIRIDNWEDWKVVLTPHLLI